MLLLGWRDGKRNGQKCEVWLIGLGMGVWEMAGMAACMDTPSDKHSKDARSLLCTREETINTHLRGLHLLYKLNSVLCFSDTSRITFQSLSDITRLTWTRDDWEHLPKMFWSKLLSINSSSRTWKMSRKPVRLDIPAGFYESNLKCALWLSLFRPFHSKHLALTEHSNWNTQGLPHIQLVVSCVNDVVCSRIRLFLSLTLSTLI